MDEDVVVCGEVTDVEHLIQVLVNKAQLYLFQCLGPEKNSMASACNRAIPTERHPSLGEDSAKKFIWDRNMVYALIEEYRKRVSEFENPSYKKRRLWSKIAHAMRVRGFKMLTDEMCDIKWRNLKKTFKEIYFGKRSTVKWEYYNVLRHIFEKDMSFYSNFGAVHRRPLLAKKTLNKKTLAEAMEVEPDSYIIDDSQEGLEEGHSDFQAGTLTAEGYGPRTVLEDNVDKSKDKEKQICKPKSNKSKPQDVSSKP
uniref:Myb/SANT-like DNA-binding domain-containing protein n=1 Tax=Timema genevievae TaxID=629358 RepID=A0A7R9PJK1_TIMGE|nr:unnamed protein product [Timema genevievae]